MAIENEVAITARPADAGCAERPDGDLAVDTMMPQAGRSSSHPTKGIGQRPQLSRGDGGERWMNGRLGMNDGESLQLGDRVLAQTEFVQNLRCMLA